MWYIITGIFIGLSSLYYFYRNRFNDEAIELFSVVYEDIKCIKYQYRGKKYIYLTYDMNDDMIKIQKEIDPTNPDKDKRPDFNYKNITFTVTSQNESDKSDKLIEHSFSAENLIYSFVGPSNTYYFAFDTKFYDKLNKFMYYLLFTEEGSITYGRLSSLLKPDTYFDIKTKIAQYKQNKIEWSFG
jgi:hypothetical protein